MMSLDQVEDQLKRVGCNFRFWNRPEIRELRNILVPGEVIAQCANGRYENGYALLVVTNHRLLLIDKKPMFLTLEDIRFDMISEIDYSAQMIEGTIIIMTPNRKLRFTGWNHGRLRTILNYTQQRVTELRQHYIERQFQSESRDNQYAAPVVGSLALQGNHESRTLPFNPYTNVPLTMRRHRIPKFY
ncbi:MAG TPA: PH domain-containing protein [Candidatus Saccharimonadales bacterium]|nr:PH domain-containing protein [Candidatus Saccharimonadales bacterium]